jgi:hypothetical protein
MAAAPPAHWASERQLVPDFLPVFSASSPTPLTAFDA